MTTRRWRLPDAPLRASVLAAAGLGLLAVALAALVIGPFLHASGRYPLAVATVFTAMGALVIGAIGSAHPFPRFGAANSVTMLRASIVALVAGLAAELPAVQIAWFVVAVTTVLAALDGVDGWLARRTRMASAFGARFDMEVDAFFILLLSVLVWRFDKAGAWVLACGLMRYAFVAAGWVLPWMARPLTPTFRGKFVAVLQVLGLAVALTPVVPSPSSDAVAAMTLAALAWSFAVDVRRLHAEAADAAGP
ncbi:MAG: CDP-alcohol phosphatidyltransferase family protein [Vicinamibacterales bacterium]